MSKNRETVTCNGRAAFYAAMWDDIRQCAMNLGWSVALHGSLAADMDIMAMPWTEEAVTFMEVVDAIVELFDGNDLALAGMEVDYESKPWGRIVATIPIWEDFYLDISTMWVEGKSEVPKPEKKKERRIVECEFLSDFGKPETIVNALFDDGSRGKVGEFYPRWTCFSINEFIGLTEKQAAGLIRERERWI